MHLPLWIHLPPQPPQPPSNRVLLPVLHSLLFLFSPSFHFALFNFCAFFILFADFKFRRRCRAPGLRTPDSGLRTPSVRLSARVSVCRRSRRHVRVCVCVYLNPIWIITNFNCMKSNGSRRPHDSRQYDAIWKWHSGAVQGGSRSSRNGRRRSRSITRSISRSRNSGSSIYRTMAAMAAHCHTQRKWVTGESKERSKAIGNIKKLKKISFENY